jgi:hypothetical protein
LFGQVERLELRGVARPQGAGEGRKFKNLAFFGQETVEVFFLVGFENLMWCFVQMQ